MSVFYFLVVSALAFITLAITIPSTPTWPDGRCTDKSLTIPSWVIWDYKVASGTATFRVDNRAHPYDGWVEITCSRSESQCHGSAASDELKVNWREGDNGQRVISFNEFWVCGDEGDHTIFTATGNTTVTSCTGSDCASPITYLAPGSLVLPVPLTPVQPTPPPGINAPTCADIRKNEWTVAGVEYRNYTKGQCKQWYGEDQICLDPPVTTGTDFVTKGEHLKLNVTNNAISHEVLCSFTPTYYDISIPNPLRCTGGNFNEITLDVRWSGTAPDFSLKVEELWYCLENPATNANPTVIVASGSTPVPLTCQSYPGITGQADDIVTRCTDPASSHAVDGIQLDKQTLPPYSLVTAYPVHGGCTFDSVVNPTFYYRGMYFHTKPFPANDPDSATLSSFTAGLTGPGFADFFFYENKAISGSGVSTVYTCAVYYDGKPASQHYNCTYSFNPHTKVITQDKVWECRDKNPSQPLYFDGSGSFDWNADPIQSCTNPGNSTIIDFGCYWHGDHANGQPGVPYDIPKVTASLINVLPPNYGQPGVSDTVRVNGKWQKMSGGT
ncbi:hypothetical protein BDV96DRAFT_639549 [Lophiotrema nucula]|uniref:AA1-like domain-containing protein n=1 Tax=Lophiotrema nucula TaxID=690887 RepID=A0A6A5ZX90_9PLEO|nr:hypothetical protein BDV96DRAFT_639549 [Lophiotrema nucula]